MKDIDKGVNKDMDKNMDDDISFGEKKQKKFGKRMGIVFGSIIAVIVVFVLLLKLTPLDNVIVDWLFKPERGGTTVETPKPDDGEEGELGISMKSETVFNFLIVGHDRAANLADFSVLVNFDTKKGTVNIMQIPRDTYVDYDGNWYHKINGVYGHYIDSSSENPELEGIAGYAKLLEDNLAVKIDYYAIMDLDQFVNIIDVLGGVYMNVPQDLYYTDPNQNLHINLKAGWQTLDGNMSEQFVRYRATFPQGDIGRGNMQKVFMAALFKTVKEKVNLLNISDICSIINENLVTNMTTGDMIYFSNYAFKVDLKYVSMMTLPGKAATLDDGLSYYCMNREAVLRYINAYFNIFTDDVTEEEFDANRTFDCGGTIYSAPADSVENIVYDAEALSDGTEENLPPT